MKKLCKIRLPIVLSVVLSAMWMIPQHLQAVEPKPGDVIDATNIDDYKEYFPNYLQMFIKGTDFVRPTVVKVRETEAYGPPPNYMKYSEANRGKFSIDEAGNLVGDHQAGMPFPEPKEPNLAEKLMWNFYFRWRSDQFYYYRPGWVAYSQRKGGPITSGSGTQFYMYFTNRTSIDPKPTRPNPNGLFFGFVQHIPDGINKDMDFLIWRYLDPTRSDEMWSYIPTLRRTLRMVSAERSNPVRGSAATYDDYYGFDGKIHEFTYDLLREETILCLMHQVFEGSSKYGGEYYEGYTHPILDEDPWELWDNYVIEIKAKDPRYPESKRVVWMADKVYYITNAEIFDKRGSFWKGTFCSYKPLYIRATDETGPWMSSQAYIDFKTCYWTGVVGRVDIECGNCDFDIEYLDPGVLGTPLFY
ncbi:MAG: DUF1329 domain-containing protein [Desulfobacterales bacterium]